REGAAAPGVAGGGARAGPRPGWETKGQPARNPRGGGRRAAPAGRSGKSRAITASVRSPAADAISRRAASLASTMFRWLQNSVLGTNTTEAWSESEAANREPAARGASAAATDTAIPARRAGVSGPAGRAP